MREGGRTKNFTTQERFVREDSRTVTMVLFLAIILVDFTTVLVAGEPTAVINTTTGPVRGEILHTAWHSMKYAAFKGIKYAESPVGYLRFKPPVPVDPWTDVLDATALGAQCTQIDDHTQSILGSEDCLFLNVFTPMTHLDETPTVLKSVMIWIYGGAWERGSSTTNLYGPDYLLERDVVFVSLNYRLGALGFLNLNHPNATGNAGLKDQNLAIKWVQANIEKFGGNPNNVTIFGDSAGGASVGYHTVSEASAGLFHGAISMSGTPLAPWSFQSQAKAKERAEKLGALIGTYSTDTETLLKAFYSASAESLVNATSEDGTFYTFTPTIEDRSIATDVFLSECSLRSYYSGKFNKVPQLLGFMEQETVTFAYLVARFFQVASEAIEALDDVRTIVPNFLKSFVDSSTHDLRTVEYDVLQALINVTTDILFVNPIDSTQKILADHNGDDPVYYYHTTFFTNKSLHNLDSDNDIVGAGHGDDLLYLFYRPGINFTGDPDDPFTRTIYRVSTMWTNFAKYGNPTPDWVDEYPLNVTWPVSGQDGLALDIGNELTVGPRPISEYVKLTELFNPLVLPVANGCI